MLIKNLSLWQGLDWTSLSCLRSATLGHLPGLHIRVDPRMCLGGIFWPVDSRRFAKETRWKMWMIWGSLCLWRVLGCLFITELLCCVSGNTAVSTVRGCCLLWTSGYHTRVEQVRKQLKWEWELRNVNTSGYNSLEAPGLQSEAVWAEERDLWTLSWAVR